MVSMLACASGGEPGLPQASPRDVEGEVVTGPAPDAEVVDATPAPPPTGKQRHDFDGDGTVDREEFRNFFARVFHATDADDDRLLTNSELAALPADSVKHADANGDGALDVAEYVGFAFVWFDRCDANADGALGPDEESSCSDR
jgi:hypothetical protein